MESQTCIFLGIKVKPGPIVRHKVENFPLENTVDSLKSEAEKETSVPSASLELIHHGKILKGNATLQDSGVKNGETVHVVKKKEPTTQPPAPTYSDAEIQQLNASLRMLGCTPNAPGWTRAMQLLNDESAMAEIVEQAPSLADDCVMLSILHEVELLAALGANVSTMRRGADAHPELPRALRQLTRLVRARSTTAATSNDNALTSGFAYSLEALSEDEDADEEADEEGERAPITHDQLSAALQQAAEAASTSSRTRQDSLLRLLQAADSDAAPALPTTPGGRPVITPEMFREAITEAIASNRQRPAGTPMEQSTAASSSTSPGATRAPAAREEDYSQSLQRMHEMGLRDDALNVRALIICEGDVNAAINLVFSGVIGDD